MKGMSVVVVLAMLAGCAESVSPPATSDGAVDAPVQEALIPVVTADQKRTINSYAAGSVIRCGTVVAMAALGKDGDRPTAEEADNVRKMHESLAGFSDAQRHLKELRSAESECIRTGSPAFQAKVRESGAALKTDVEMIPE